MPATLILGGLFTLLCDDLSRILMPGEIPLGIITSLFGAISFIMLLSMTGVKSQR